MTKKELLNKLNRRDLSGVGCVVKTSNGCTQYYYYEDFPNDNGIDRAQKYFTSAINSGDVRRVDYIYHNSTTVHFWDWNEKSGNFCASDEFRYFNKCFGFKYYYKFQKMITVINGLEYKYDYTPAIDGISAIVALRAN